MLMFVTMYLHRSAIEQLGTEVRRHNQALDSKLTIRQFARSKRARASFVVLSTEMQWLLPKIEKFKASQWYASVEFLLLRLFQTSFMALLRTQETQAALMCYLSVLSALLLQKLDPMRVATDTDVIVLAQALIFLWTFVLLLRTKGMLENEVGVAVGYLLCIVTVGVCVVALMLADVERRKQRCADRRESESDEALATTSQDESEPTMQDEDNEAEAENKEQDEFESSGRECEGKPVQAAAPPPLQVGDVEVGPLQVDEKQPNAVPATEGPWSFLSTLSSPSTTTAALDCFMYPEDEDSQRPTNG